MALVYNGLSTYRLSPAYQAAAAWLGAGVAEAASRRSERFLLASINDFCGSEHRSSSRQRGASRRRPGSVFDARYIGLAAQAAFIDAAICRRQCMR
jgi:hypothetical protein